MDVNTHPEYSCIQVMPHTHGSTDVYINMCTYLWFCVCISVMSTDSDVCGGLV